MSTRSAVLDAVRAGNVVELERLLSDGADPNEAYGLLSAVEPGLGDAAKLLLAYGADPSVTKPQL